MLLYQFFTRVVQHILLSTINYINLHLWNIHRALCKANNITGHSEVSEIINIAYNLMAIDYISSDRYRQLIQNIFLAADTVGFLIIN